LIGEKANLMLKHEEEVCFSKSTTSLDAADAFLPPTYLAF
jgi:hypothetical protein